MSLTLNGDSPYFEGATDAPVEWQLLATSSITSSVATHTLDMTAYAANWMRIKVVFNNVTSVSDGVSLYGKPSTDGGSSFLGGSDIGASVQIAGQAGGTPSITGVTGPWYVDIVAGAGLGNASDECAGGECIMFNHNDTARRTMFYVWSVCTDDTNSVRGTTQYMHIDSLLAIDALGFSASTGNLDDGDFWIYGGGPL